TTGTTGSNACVANACLNGGTCQSVLGGGFRCTCSVSFTGNRCEYPSGTIGISTSSACPVNACLNSGTCQSVPGGGYRCICRAGFTGARCDVSQSVFF
ncbi:unnamed protein product, partial [Adineta steineri]